MTTTYSFKRNAINDTKLDLSELDGKSLQRVQQLKIESMGTNLILENSIEQLEVQKDMFKNAHDLVDNIQLKIDDEHDTIKKQDLINLKKQMIDSEIQYIQSMGNIFSMQRDMMRNIFFGKSENEASEKDVNDHKNELYNVRKKKTTLGMFIPSNDEKQSGSEIDQSKKIDNKKQQNNKNNYNKQNYKTKQHIKLDISNDNDFPPLKFTKSKK